MSVFVACPHCKARVIPMSEGTCPSCMHPITGSGGAFAAEVISTKIAEEKGKGIGVIHGFLRVHVFNTIYGLTAFFAAMGLSWAVVKITATGAERMRIDSKLGLCVLLATFLPLSYFGYKAALRKAYYRSGFVASYGHAIGEWIQSVRYFVFFYTSPSSEEKTDDKPKEEENVYRLKKDA